MMRLLKIELLKLFPYRIFKILFGLYLLFLLGMLLTADNFFGGLGAVQEDVLKFPNIWNYYSLCASYFNILLGIIAIFLMCNEITFRTLRQNVIDGLTRTEAALGKIILVIFIAIITTLFLLISGLIAGSMNGSLTPETHFYDHISFLFAYFIQSVGVMSMGLLAANIFKRAAPSIIIFLVFIFPLDIILRKVVFSNWPETGNYLPVENYFWKLVPVPADNIQSHGDDPTQSFPNMLSVLISSGYAILFFVLSVFSIRSRDL